MSNARIPVKTRLKKWHLSRDPFPLMPYAVYFNEDPLVNGSVFAPTLRQEQIDQIRTEVLRSGYPEMVKRWSWVWAHKRIGGSLGMGKSALLGYVTDQINQDFGSSFFHRAAPWLVVYVKVSEKTQSTAQVMATALASIYDTAHGMSVERRLVGRLRHKAIALNSPQQYTALLSAEPESKFADDQWLESQGVQLEALNKDVADLLKRETVRAGVADAVARCTLKDWVARYKDDADSPLFKPAQANEAYLILLNDIAKIAQAADLIHVTVILDDYYYLVKNTKPGDREALAAEWRAIVVESGYKASKSNVFNWVAVMHTKTAGNFNTAWETASMHDVAPLFLKVGDTIGRPGVHLHALPMESGRQLLEAYLKYSRVGKVPSPIYPFTEDAIAYILEGARRKGKEQEGKCDPRSLLEVAAEVFEETLFDSTEHDEIDLAFTQRVLKAIPSSELALPPSAEAIEAADEAAVIPSERRLPLSVVCGCACHQEDNTPADDLIALMAGGVDENAPDAIIRYVCRACNTPVPIAS